MKKLLIMPLLAAALFTGVQAAENELQLNATMADTAYVAFGAAAAFDTTATDTVTGAKNFRGFDAANVVLQIDDDVQSLMSQTVNLITNNQSQAIQMKITSSPELLNTTTNSTDDTLAVACTYAKGTGTDAATAALIEVDSPFALSGTATTNSNNAVGTFECHTTGAAAATAGTYQSTIAVEVISSLIAPSQG